MKTNLDVNINVDFATLIAIIVIIIGMFYGNDKLNDFEEKVKNIDTKIEDVKASVNEVKTLTKPNQIESNFPPFNFTYGVTFIPEPQTIDFNKCREVICGCAKNTTTPCMVVCYEC